MAQKLAEMHIDSIICSYACSAVSGLTLWRVEYADFDTEDLLAANSLSNNAD